MTRPRHAAGADRADRADRTAGFTLVEYVVAMSIFAVIIGITVSSIAFMTRDVVKTTNLSTATDQLRQAFSRLDRQVRYADAVNRPGKNTAGTIWYVEFEGPDSDGTDTCHQWRVDTSTKLLQERQWVPAATTLPGWTTVASYIANDTTAAEAPFTLVPAGANNGVQSLDVQLIGERRSTNTATVTLQTSMAARNSSGSPTGEDTNGDGASDTPVCTFGTGVNRP